MGAYVESFLTNAMDGLLLYFYMLRMGNQTHQCNRKKFVLGMFFLVLANSAINQIMGIASLPGFAIMFIFITLTFAYLLNKGITHVFLLLLFGIVLMFLLELFTVNLVIFMFKLPPVKMLLSNWYRFLGIIISKGSFYIIVRYWANKFPKLYEERMLSRPIGIILLFNIVMIYVSFVIYHDMDYSDIGQYRILFLLMIGAIAVSWAVYILTKRMVLQYQQEELLNLKLREYENQRLYIHNMEDMLLNIRAQRHDLNNYISTLYGMIHLEKFEEAKKYMINLEKNISSVNQIVDANHPVITALLSVKYQKAQREGIHIQVRVQISEHINMDYIDLSIILGNILDNAIEACIGSEAAVPYIKLAIYMKDCNLIIEMENSKNQQTVFNNSLMTQGYTTKAEKEGHGFGLTNIQKIIDKSHGVLKLEDEGKCFTTKIGIPIKADQ